MNGTLQKVRTSPLAVVAGFGFALATSAFAANPAEAFTLSMEQQFGTSDDYTGSTAELDFDFMQQGDNVLLNLEVTNNTDSDIGSTLVGVVLDLPAIGDWAYDALETSFTKEYEGNSAALNPFGTFSFGFRSEGPGGSFNGGNPKEGLRDGESGMVSFLFSNLGGMSAEDVENAFLAGFENSTLRAAARFQQVGADGEDSDKVLAGFVETTSNEVAQSVPGSGTAFALGLFAMGSLQGLKKKKQ